MRIEDIRFEVYQDSVDAELNVKIEYSVTESSKLPVLHLCEASIGKIKISDLVPYNETNTDTAQRLRYRTKTRVEQQRFEQHFRMPLSRKALEFIEKYRSSERNKKRDVHLTFKFTCLMLETHVQNVYETISNTQYSLVHTGGNDEFLVGTRYVYIKNVTIPSSDWVNDYSPHLGNGTFRIVEIPQPEFFESKESFPQKLQTSIDWFYRMTDTMLKGDWTTAIEEGRKVWETIYDQQTLNDILESDNFDETTIAAFKDLFKAFHELSSKFHHTIGKAPGRQLLKSNKADKEDAELLHLLTAGVINFISRKVQRQNQ